MKNLPAWLVLGFLMCGAADGQTLIVGKSRADQWTENPAGKGKKWWRQLAITSSDQKSELIVEFFPELGGLGMTVMLLDRPALPCDKATLNAIPNSALLLDGKPLPGTGPNSFTVGCRDERWIEHMTLGSVDADVTIVEALLDSKRRVVRLSSADGRFDHSYAVNGFLALERGDLNLYRHSKAYRLGKSMEH